MRHVSFFFFEQTVSSAEFNRYYSLAVLVDGEMNLIVRERLKVKF